MYGHGFAMLFLAQAYGVEQNAEVQRRIRAVLRNAVRLTGEAQSRDGGWNYTPDSGGDEGSVTITQVQALRAARNAGIHVPKSVITRAIAYIAGCACDDGGIAYRISRTGVGRGRGLPAITAAAVAVLYNAGEYEHPVARRALLYLQRHLKGQTATRASGHAYYMLFYAAQAMYLSGEHNWRTFFPKHRDELIGRQTDEGSWADSRTSTSYATPAALIVLQLPYARLPILQR
jgi:hypothetical protein